MVLAAITRRSQLTRVPQPLLVLGAGGLGRESVEAVRAVNEQRQTWDILGFLDDSTAAQGTTLSGVSVLGPFDMAADHPSASLLLCVGKPGDTLSRLRAEQRLGVDPARYATVVHPGAHLARSADLGPGCIVLAGAVATADVRVGAHVALMPHVVLTHDDVVGAFSMFGAGAQLAGSVHVGDGAYVGSGASVREGRRIGPWAVLGMGSVALDDIPAGEVWAGVPARRLRGVELPADVVPRGF